MKHDFVQTDTEPKAPQPARPNAAVLTMAVLLYITHRPMGVQNYSEILDTSAPADGTCGGANYRSKKVSGDKSGIVP